MSAIEDGGLLVYLWVWMVLVPLCFLSCSLPKMSGHRQWGLLCFLLEIVVLDSRRLNLWRWKLGSMGGSLIRLLGWPFRTSPGDLYAYWCFSQLLLEVPCYELMVPASLDGKKSVSRSSCIFGLMTFVNGSTEFCPEVAATQNSTSLGSLRDSKSLITIWFFFSWG